MKLSEFVRAVINEICDGVMEAANHVDQKTHSHPIAPGIVNGELMKFNEDRIHFEISTIVREEQNLEGNMKGGIYVFTGGVDSSKTHETQNVSKISFAIPVEFRAVKKPK
jgi:hypothetical protein